MPSEHQSFESTARSADGGKTWTGVVQYWDSGIEKWVEKVLPDGTRLPTAYGGTGYITADPGASDGIICGDGSALYYATDGG